MTSVHLTTDHLPKKHWYLSDCSRYGFEVDLILILKLPAFKRYTSHGARVSLLPIINIVKNAHNGPLGRPLTEFDWFKRFKPVPRVPPHCLEAKNYDVFLNKFLFNIRWIHRFFLFYNYKSAKFQRKDPTFSPVEESKTSIKREVTTNTVQVILSAL